MTQSLIILRHAQAQDISDGHSHDFYRTLTRKGQRQATKVGNKLKELNIKPDLIITSSSARTYETASIVANILGIKYNQIIIDSNLYRCTRERRIETISYFNGYKTILVVGHNPELLSLCNYYSHGKTPELKKGQYVIIRQPNNPEAITRDYG